MIVLDAPNVAMRHGRGKQFSCDGISLAIVYYQKRGHRVVAFLPDSYMDTDTVSKLRRARDVREVACLPSTTLYPVFLLCLGPVLCVCPC